MAGWHVVYCLGAFLDFFGPSLVPVDFTKYVSASAPKRLEQPVDCSDVYIPCLVTQAPQDPPCISLYVLHREKRVRARELCSTAVHAAHSSLPSSCIIITLSPDTPKRGLTS